MTFDALEEPLTLPRRTRTTEDNPEPEALLQRIKTLETFIDDLVRILNDQVLGQQRELQNLQLLLINVGVFYFQLPNTDGTYDDGDVRLRKTAQDTVVMEVHDGTGWNIRLARWRNDD
jgi:hypothetical protein